MPIPAILLAISIVVAYVAPPGIILSETIRRGLRGGFWPAFAVQVGSIVADLVYAFLGLTGAAIIVTIPPLRVAIGLFGVAFMVFIGVTGLRDATRDDPSQGDRPPGGDDPSSAAGPTGRLGMAFASRGPLLAGAGLGLANPWAAAFWLGIGGTLAAAGLAAATPVDLAAFLVTYVVGLVAYGALVSAIAGIGHRRLDRGWLRVAEAISAAAILVFAAILAVRVAEVVRAALG